MIEQTWEAHDVRAREQVNGLSCHDVQPAEVAMVGEGFFRLRARTLLRTEVALAAGGARFAAAFG